MKVNQLLTSIDIVNHHDIGHIDIQGISYHSEKVRDNFMFVCVKGRVRDGHDYLTAAIKRGAKVAIVEEFQEDISIPPFVVKSSRKALAQLSSTFYNHPNHPSSKLKMIGITATNGKTSTTYMTNAILENAGLKTGLMGMVIIKVDDTSITSELTTPESLDLQYYLNQMVEKNVSHVSMEVSSAALEMHRTESW